MSSKAVDPKGGLNILELLRPHSRQLWLGLFAIAGDLLGLD